MTRSRQGVLISARPPRLRAPDGRRQPDPAARAGPGQHPLRGAPTGHRIPADVPTGTGLPQLPDMPMTARARKASLSFPADEVLAGGRVKPNMERAHLTHGIRGIGRKSTAPIGRMQRVGHICAVGCYLTISKERAITDGPTERATNRR